MCLILAIETSCDETSVALVKDGRTVLSNIIASQIETHQLYGGVVPEIASRKHIEAINYVMSDALAKAGVKLCDITAIAVTAGPGLVGALLVGVSFAKALSFALNIPLIPVHHIEGHIAANYIEHPHLEPPFICLVASGGHSHIVSTGDYLDFKVLGQTRDDAAGEAFDKIARVMELGYPGGPIIDKIAKQGNPNAVKFPRVNFENNSLDFSFSGLKTAVINYIHKQRQQGIAINTEDIAASFQAAVVDVLVDNTIKAALSYNLKTICIAGGVAANSALRLNMKAEAEKKGINVYYPSPILCTDNAAMIGCAGYYGFKNNHIADMSLNAYPALRLGQSIG